MAHYRPWLIEKLFEQKTINFGKSNLNLLKSPNKLTCSNFLMIP